MPNKAKKELLNKQRKQCHALRKISFVFQSQMPRQRRLIKLAQLSCTNTLYDHPTLGARAAGVNL